MAEQNQAETFEMFVAKERERLTKKREEITNRQRKLGEELAAVEQELAAIDAYEAVKSGRAPRARRGSGSRAPRGAVRGKVLEAVKSQPEGATRGEVIEMLGVKGDDKGERQTSAALAALTKNAKLKKAGDKYVAA